MSALVLAVLVAGGATLLVVGILLRGREREKQLADILDLPWGERDVPTEAIEQRAALVDSTVGFASKMIEQFDAKGALAKNLERARIPLRAGEYLVVSAGFAVGAATLLWFFTKQWWFILFTLALAPFVASAFLRYKVAKRRKAFQAQLPDALSLIASSLSAGHTFLRAIQMMTEEAPPPMSQEFARVVYETRLGDSLIDALERMAKRLEIRDLDWIVQAIRVQQTVGGKLADLLHTLADFIRAREEVRREVQVLTAEGRISAYVLGALPIFLLVAISVESPNYMKPMFHGWGIWWLGGTLASVMFGMGVILRMVKMEV